MPQPQENRRQRPVCPIHGVPLLVGRTRGRVQYRYCTIAGCHASMRTRRYPPSVNGTAIALAGGVHE